jgi:hypothetical protein
MAISFVEMKKIFVWIPTLFVCLYMSSCLPYEFWLCWYEMYEALTQNFRTYHSAKPYVHIYAKRNTKIYILQMWHIYRRWRLNSVKVQKWIRKMTFTLISHFNWFSMTSLFYGAVPLLLRGGRRPGLNLYTLLMWGALVSKSCLFYGAVPSLLRGGWQPGRNLNCWRETHWFLLLIYSMVQCLYYCEEEVGQGGISIADVRSIGFYNLFILWCSASTIARRKLAKAESLLLT